MIDLISPDHICSPCYLYLQSSCIYFSAFLRYDIKMITDEMYWTIHLITNSIGSDILDKDSGKCIVYIISIHKK